MGLQIQLTSANRTSQSPDQFCFPAGPTLAATTKMASVGSTHGCCEVYHHHHHRHQPTTPSAVSNIRPLRHLLSPITTHTNPRRQLLNTTTTGERRRLNSRTILACSGGDRNSSTAEAPAKALRRILESPGVYQGPACFDALSAKLVERAGFDFCFTTGNM